MLTEGGLGGPLSCDATWWLCQRCQSSGAGEASRVESPALCTADGVSAVSVEPLVEHGVEPLALRGVEPPVLNDV